MFLYNAYNKSSSSRFLKALSARVQLPINLLIGAGEALRDLSYLALGSTGLQFRFTVPVPAYRTYSR